jgi:hypothetical protein
VADKSPILELLLNFKDRVHRVIVKENNTNELLRIVSQSDMLQFIQARLDTCGDVRLLTVLSFLCVSDQLLTLCDGWLAVEGQAAERAEGDRRDSDRFSQHQLASPVRVHSDALARRERGGRG